MITDTKVMIELEGFWLMHSKTHLNKQTALYAGFLLIKSL